MRGGALVGGVVWVSVAAGGCASEAGSPSDTEGSSSDTSDPMAVTLTSAGAGTSGPTSATATTDSTRGSTGASSGDESTGAGSTTGSAACELELTFPEALDDAICPPDASTEQRLQACLCSLSPTLLEQSDRPLDATNLLYYVNRFYSIDPCFPFDPDPAVLSDVREQYINQVDNLEPQLESLCGEYQNDLIDVPPGLTNDDDQLRQVAWSSAAPAGYDSTLDGLPVGFDGDVGFGPMFEAAFDEAGVELYVRSGFRSMETQAALFAYYADLEGDPAIAATYSAWPSHSEHQLGTTADVGYIQDGVMLSPFAPLEADLHWTEAFVWIRANAHRFGIVTTYQPQRVHVHQYKPEPWHLRFVGVQAADVMHACNLSTEEALAYRYRFGVLPVYADLDLVYEAQLDGGWNPDTCAD